MCNGFISAQQFYTNTGCKEQFSNTGYGGFSMGVRPVSYLQLDAVGLDLTGTFNDLGNRKSTFQCVSGCTGSQTLKIGTTNGLVTTGAKLVLPLFRQRLLLSAGGGYSWLRSFEHPDSNGAKAQCYSCQSVSGSGPMESAEIMYFPNQHFGIGLRVPNFQVRSAGLTTDAVFSNSYLGTRYRDQFMSLGVVLSIRAGKERR